MAAAVAHSWYMTVRDLRALIRQPWWIAISLVQPMIWLLLFSQLFKRIVDIPGFGAESYVDFLTPGVVVMSAIFSGGWSGMSTIQDIDRGILDRFLVSPVRRAAIITGRVAQQAIVVAIQSLIIVGVGILAGFSGDPVGIVVLVLAGVLLSSSFAGLSNALGLLMRREESLIGAVQFIVLPLTFLASAFMPEGLLPGWMQTVSDYNPVTWAVVAGRAALEASPDWGTVAANLGYLAALMVACAFAATRAFRSYQRSA